MIFMYPALVSGNIDDRYYPAMIKTMELYFLHHLVEAVANGSIRFYVSQNAVTGSFSDVRMEHLDTDGNVLFEYSQGTPRQPSDDILKDLESKRSELTDRITTANRVRHAVNIKLDIIRFSSVRDNNNMMPLIVSYIC